MRRRILLLVALGSLVLYLGSPAVAVPRVRVEMREFAFHPSIIRLTAGVPAVVELVNRGQIAHQFDAPILRRASVTVLDDQMQVETTGLEFVRVQPGGRTSIRFMIRTRGRFPFTCTIEGHREAGMVGVLEVR